MTNKAALKPSGFTLVELMVVVAIIGILAAIAIPNYQSHIRRAYRADAIEVFTNMMSAQESYYGDNVTYTTDLTDLGYAVNGSGFYEISDSNGSVKYLISASACPGTTLTQCVQLDATAQGTMVEDGNLSFNTYGTETRTLPNGTVTDW
jgi:type IV pilus assembly protein PilE